MGISFTSNVNVVQPVLITLIAVIQGWYTLIYRGEVTVTPVHSPDSVDYGRY